eukprot:11209169-Lingulodinium_polyedra.AAC.1
MGSMTCAMPPPSGCATIPQSTRNCWVCHGASPAGSRDAGVGAPCAPSACRSWRKNHSALAARRVERRRFRFARL